MGILPLYQSHQMIFGPQFLGSESLMAVDLWAIFSYGNSTEMQYKTFNSEGFRFFFLILWQKFWQTHVSENFTCIFL